MTCFHSFFERIETPKSPFEIDWPLECAGMAVLFSWWLKKGCIDFFKEFLYHKKFWSQTAPQKIGVQKIIVWTVLKTKKVGKTQNVTCFNLIANVLYAIKFMDSPLVLCIVCNCQGRKNQPPLSLLFCHNYSYCAVYKLTSGNCTVVKINNNPTFRLTRPFCLMVLWYYCITLE